jgi:hypothetical protein
MFGPEKEDVARGWSKLHSGEFQHFSPRQMLSVDQIRKDEMNGTCGTRETCIEVFGWKTLRKETIWKT